MHGNVRVAILRFLMTRAAHFDREHGLTPLALCEAFQRLHRCRLDMGGRILRGQVL